MGWASGSAVLIEVARAAKAHLNPAPSKKKRVQFYEEVVAALESMDCDTITEAEGIDPALDVVIARNRMEYTDEDYEDEYLEAKAALKKAEKWLARR